MFIYLLEKRHDNKTYEYKYFLNVEELFSYLTKHKSTIFNYGFNSTEIVLNRVRDNEEKCVIKELQSYEIGGNK